LIAALGSTHLEAEATEMAALIAEYVPDIPTEDLKGIVDTVYALYAVREFSEVEYDRFLADLVADIVRHTDFKDSLSVTIRFDKLLSIEKLSMLSKAIKLQRDGERLYCEAKILSDVRPVFGDGPIARPLASVVTYTMKIIYHEGGEHKEFFIVLDRADLVELHDVLGRAKLKDRELRDLLAETKLPVLGI